MGNLPVVWPGFSWGNLKQGHTKYSIVRCSNGHVLRIRDYEWLQASHKQWLVATFGEIDEETAVYEVVNDKISTPASH